MSDALPKCKRPFVLDGKLTKCDGPMVPMKGMRSVVILYCSYCGSRG